MIIGHLLINLIILDIDAVLTLSQSFLLETKQNCVDLKHPYWDPLKNLVIITLLCRNLNSNINFLLIRDLVFISNSITLALTNKILLQKKEKKK